MDLKNLVTKLKPKEEPPEYFFAVELTDDIVKSAVWTVADGHTQVVKLGSTQTWDGQHGDSLLKAVDQSISQASDNLEPEPNGIVFGLPEAWLSQDNINSDKKQYLKKICQELELKPLGFVVTDTAIIKYLKIEEGTPPSAIFLQLSSSGLTLSLVKLGKTIGTQLVGKSEDLGSDVEEGLSRFDKLDTLPARMILYNGKADFEEAKQQLVSYDWEEKLPFIHFPKVEVLTEDITIKAIALAGGSEVAKSLGFTIKPPAKKATDPDSSDQPSSAPPPASTPATAASLGFTSQDIAEDLEPESESDPISSSPPQTAVPQTAVPQTAEPEPQDFEPSSRPISPSAPHSRPQLASVIQPVKAFFSGFINKLKNLKNFQKTPKTITLVAIGFSLLFIGLFAVYWYVPKAKITIFVEAEVIDEDLTLTIDPDADTLDADARIIPGKSVDISIEGSQTSPTTGTAQVGDPAQGEVTIYNKTSQATTLDSGTVLIGPDNLAFTLDDDTEIASSSTQEKDGGEETIWGKTTASITAKSIGPDSNLSGGTQLSFQKYSEDDYSAKVNDGLSGGTAREVKAVSQADQDALLEVLTDELKAKAAADLKSQLGDGMSLVDVEDQSQLISKSFNHDVDEEADSLKLDAKLEYSALAYQQTDLDLLLQQTIKEKIPDNFQLSQSSEIEVEPAELDKDGTATVEVVFKAKLIPKLDFTDIKQSLKGRYPHITQEYLSTLPNFVKADIIITPNLPAKLKTLPHVVKNITLEIKTQAD